MEDVNKCVMALQEGDADSLDRTAGAIRGRSARICSVVESEMQNYESGLYVEKVSEAVLILREQGKLDTLELDIFGVQISMILANTCGILSKILWQCMI